MIRSTPLLATLVVISLVASPAESTEPVSTADENERQDYGYVGRRFGWGDYLGTGWALGAFYAIESGVPATQRPHWSQTIPPFDEPMRDWLAAPTREQRELADQVSDYFWYANVAYPVLAGLVIPPIRGADFDMVWQIQMMNLQAFALISVVVRLPHKLVGRTRPNDLGCAEDPEYDAQCVNPSSRYVSFPGGHVGVSMTGAGLTCAHHLHADLFGGGFADYAMCAAATMSANVVGIMRIRADKHWFTDHVVGAASGFAIGYGLPTLLYYHPFWKTEEELAREVREHEERAPSGDELRWTLAPQIDGERWGLAVVGIF